MSRCGDHPAFPTVLISSVKKKRHESHLRSVDLQTCTMKTILPLITVFAAVLTEVTSQSCASHSNGCSIPFNLPYFFKSRFTPSCDKHDVCYACATYFGRTQNDCDRMLYNDANRVCSSMRKRFILSTLTAAERDFCKAISLSYYAAVNHFGYSHFPARSSSWCSESWVRSCMP